MARAIHTIFDTHRSSRKNGKNENLPLTNMHRREFENEQLKYNLETVIEKFNNYCQPRKNLTFLTHTFFTCKEKDQQRFDDYVTELRSKANQCEFGEISNRLIKYMLVCGLRDNALKERIIAV